MNALQPIKRNWQENGTKIIGYATTLVGILGVLDAGTVGLVTKAIGPVWGGRFALVCMISAGVATALRGHKNTADIANATVSQASTGEVQAAAKVVTDVAKSAQAADDAAAGASIKPGDPK